jgi:hypothetical protein
VTDDVIADLVRLRLCYGSRNQAGLLDAAVSVSAGRFMLFVHTLMQ